MKILKCYVENFGILHEYEYCPAEGLSVVYAKNGSGKSTFAAFIRAMFYGMTADRTRKSLENAERRRYKPWQGGVWGGYICFSVKDKSYRLERTFGEKEREDTFRLTDLKTGLASNDYSENIGFELFGIDKEAYTATAFVNWKYMQVQVNESMTIQLEDMANDSGIENLENAVALLDSEYKQYVKTGNRGEIAELEKEISALSMKEWKLKAELKDKKSELENVFLKETKGKEADKDSLSLTETEKKRLHELDDYFAAGVPDMQELEDKLRDEEEKLSALYRSNEEKTDMGNGNTELSFSSLFVVFSISEAVIFIMAAAMAVVAAVKAFPGSKGYIYVISAAVLLLLAGASGAAAFKSCRRRNTGGEGYTDSQSYAEEKFSIEEQRRKVEAAGLAVRNAREYKYLWEKEDSYEAAKKQLRELKGRHFEKTLKEETDKINAQLEETNKRLNEAKQEKERLKHRAELLFKTKEYLLQARAGYTVKLIDGISDKFYGYLQAFDSELAGKVRLNADYGIELLENGIYRSIDYYSSGIKDIIWFCERMAFTQKICTYEKPLIVLDDTFVSMDNEMQSKAFALLDGLTKDFQVIYLSCHAKEMYNN